jgi:hypothetical protein
VLKLSIYAAEQPERTRQKLVPERVGTALSRSQRSLKRRGLALKGVDTGTPTGRLFLNIVGSIAEFEREIMLERQREGIAAARSSAPNSPTPCRCRATPWPTRSRNVARQQRNASGRANLRLAPVTYARARHRRDMSPTPSNHVARHLPDTPLL